MPGLTLPDLIDDSGWGAPIPGEPWDLPTLTVRGNGVIKLVDSEDLSKVNRLERLSLEFHVPCPGPDDTDNGGILRVSNPVRTCTCGGLELVPDCVSCSSSRGEAVEGS